MKILRCKCCYEIDDENKEINPNYYRIISDMELDLCYETLPDENEVEDSFLLKQFSNNLMYYYKQVLICPICNRLTIYENNSDVIASYMKEED